VYRAFIHLRGEIRSRIATFFRAFVSRGGHPEGCTELLEVTGAIGG
jgi:hypothetical protein